MSEAKDDKTKSAGATAAPPMTDAEKAEAGQQKTKDAIKAYDEATDDAGRKAALGVFADDTLAELVRIDLECRRGGTSLGQVLSKTVQNIAGIAGI